jgi:hypothetical protein
MTVKVHDASIFFFERVWVHFGIPMSIISCRFIGFLSVELTILWERMENKLNISTIYMHKRMGKHKW